MQHSLNVVIKKMKQLIKLYEKTYGKDCIQANYYKIISRNLLLEHKYKDIVEKSGKPIYHYFMYSLPEYNNDYFYWLYNPYNPVRFACETFDSIEEIRIEFNKLK